MLSNLSKSLIAHKRIQTTLAKAKALRKYVEPLITKAKYDSTHARRMVFSYLQDKEAVKELFITVADKVGDRPGGYTRIIKLGPRLGDGAETAMIELVDFNENLLAEQQKTTRRRRRRRRKGGGSGSAAAAGDTESAGDDQSEAENQTGEAPSEQSEDSDQGNEDDDDETNERKSES